MGNLFFAVIDCRYDTEDEIVLIIFAEKDNAPYTMKVNDTTIENWLEKYSGGVLGEVFQTLRGFNFTVDNQ